MLPNIFHECTRALLLFYKHVYENYGRKSAGEFFVICDGLRKNTSHKKQHQQNQTHHRKEALYFSRFSELWKRSTISFVIFGAPGKKHYVFGENLRSEWGGRRGGVPTWPPKAAEKNHHWQVPWVPFGSGYSCHRWNSSLSVDTI